MKVLVYCPDLTTAAAIAQDVESANHIVSDTVIRLAVLPQAIIRQTPQLLFAVGAPDGLARDMERLFPDLVICAVDSTRDLTTALNAALAQPPRPYTPRRYADDYRLVLHDDGFSAFAKGKLHVPSQEPGWEAVAQHQEIFFLLQLYSAQKNHESAKRYLACLHQQQADIDQEVTYRLLHNSYKGLSWTRDLAIRWCALLSHYVHGVELDYLPSPHPASPSADYVHQEPSLGSAYAVAVLAAGRPRQTMLDQIIPLSVTRFTGQSDDKLLALSTTLYGLAKAIQVVAESQVTLMEVWLDASRCNVPDSLPRSTHRTAGIYREFWGFEYIVNMPEPLTSILQGFHAGTTRLAEYPCIAPTFRELRRVYTGGK